MYLGVIFGLIFACFFIYACAPIGWKIAARMLNAAFNASEDVSQLVASESPQINVPQVVIRASGEYEIHIGEGRSLRAGRLHVHYKHQDYSSYPTSVTQNLQLLGQSTAPVTDEFGTGVKHSFRWELPGTGIRVETDIMVYPDQPFIKFQLIAPSGINDTTTGQFHAPIFKFPCFEMEGPTRRVFAYRTQVFSPPMKDLHDATTQGPAVFYDNALNTVVLGPADHFMVASTGQDQNLVYHGLEGLIESLPAGFTHAAILFFAHGINASVVGWCDLLRRIYKVPARDPYQDRTLATLGYWTDNGAYYYYKTEKGLNYQDTLLRAKAIFDKKNIPFQYIQLDSWWYQKLPKTSWTRPPKKWFARLVKGLAMGGTNVWEPMPEHFPDGMAAFREQVGIPIVAHARWFSPQSDYVQRYKFEVSEFGVYPLDRRFWDDLMQDAARWGFILYEQDWIITMFKNIPLLTRDVQAAEDWLTWMADAATRNHITIQYCMAPPGAFLYALQLPGVTNARTGGDYWARAPKEFFFVPISQANILAWGAGIWPSFDTFYSYKSSIFTRQFLYRERYPALTALLSTLGGGLVCPGDRPELADADLLLKTCREDGVLLKPDRPITCNDLMFKPHAKPYIMDTATKRGNNYWRYIVIVNFWPRRVKDPHMTMQEIGEDGGGVLYDFFGRTLREITTMDVIPLPKRRMAYKYFIFAPFLLDGVALIGAPEKFVTCASKLIPEVSVEECAVEFCIDYLPLLNLKVLLYARPPPTSVSVTDGDAHIDWRHAPDTHALEIAIEFVKEPSCVIRITFMTGNAPCEKYQND